MRSFTSRPSKAVIERSSSRSGRSNLGIDQSIERPSCMPDSVGSDGHAKLGKEMRSRLSRKERSGSDGHGLR